jgi:hypothetical protein
MIRTASALALAWLLLVAPVVAAADDGRTTFSGTIAAIDVQERVLLVDEVGPWRTAQDRTLTTRHTVLFTAHTKFNTFIRVNVPGAFAGDFIEVELDADSVTPGDFATVECVRERGRLVAVRVTLAEAYTEGNVPTP